MKGNIGIWSIVVIILGLIVMMTMMNVSYGVKGIFDRWNPFENPDDYKFVPYEVKLTPQEKKIQDSTNALICSLNMAAKGISDFESCPVQGRMISKEKNEVSYGDSKVTCSGGASDYNEFDLKPHKAVAAQEIADEIKKCWKKFEANKKQDVRCAKLSLPIGDVIPEDSVERLLEDSKILVWWELSDPMAPGQTAFLCGHDGFAWRNGVWISSSFKCDLPKEKEIEFACAVNNFNLPQDVTFAEEYIAGYGDPKFLVYYESFHPEAAAHWQYASSLTWDVYTLSAITLGGVINVGAAWIPGAGKAISKKIFGEAAEAATKKIMSEGVETLVKRAVKFGDDNAVRALLVQESLEGIEGIGSVAAKEMTDEMLEVGGRVGASEIGRASYDMLVKEDMKQAVEATVLKQIEKGAIEAGAATNREAAEKIAAEILEEMSIPATSGVGYKGLHNMWKETWSPGFFREVLKERSAQNFLKSFLTEAGSINTKALTETAESALRNSNELLENPTVTPEARNKLFMYSKALLDGTLAKFGWTAERRAAEMAGQGALGKGSIFLIDQIPLALPTLNFGADVISVGVSKIPAGIRNRLPQFIQKASAETMAKESIISVGGMVGAVPNWMANHPYSTIILLNSLFAMNELRNEKYLPHGINTVVLGRPSLAGDSNPIDLVPEAEKFHIRLEEKPDRRMYFVSPCKAELVVKSTSCSCVSTSSPVYDFGGGIQNFQKGTVFLKPNYELRSLVSAGTKNKDEVAAKIKEIQNIFVDVHKRPETYVLDDAKKTKLKELDPYIEKDLAVKECYTQSTAGYITSSGFGWVKEKFGYEPYKGEHYDVKCIEIDVQVDEGYCYDDFPIIQNAKYSLIGIQVLSDVIISGVTGGTGTLPWLFVSGSAAAAGDLYLSTYERWP